MGQSQDKLRHIRTDYTERHIARNFFLLSCKSWAAPTPGRDLGALSDILHCIPMVDSTCSIKGDNLEGECHHCCLAEL